MEMSEIREAASSVAMQAPSEREQFIKDSYQSANTVEIELIKRLAEHFDDMANDCYNGKKGVINGNK